MLNFLFTKNNKLAIKDKEIKSLEMQVEFLKKWYDDREQYIGSLIKEDAYIRKLLFEVGNARGSVEWRAIKLKIHQYFNSRCKDQF
jgi:hypothetical protein